MPIEIERKFLLKDNSWKASAGKGVLIVQGYLSTAPERTVRVRIYGDQGFLTIKGKSSGISRAEFEYPIPSEEAKELLLLCEYPPIEKYRFKIERDGLVWELDEFFGANEGLLLAEVELVSEDQKILLPEWLGEEVSGDHRYYNSSLALHPFSKWKHS